MNRIAASHQDVAKLDVDLDSVISTLDLSRRPTRPPDYASENRALVALLEAMTASPDDSLQKLAETALDLYRAHSAGSVCETSITRSLGAPQFLLVFDRCFAVFWVSRVDAGKFRRFRWDRRQLP
jgi:hypothetical protein